MSPRPPELSGARVTLQRIAAELGVSTATVSLALRSSPLVADATRDRVQAVARDLGYVYNRSAASLRTARTNMIAVGVNDIVNPYFGELLAAIEETLAGSGHTVLLGTYSDDPAKQDRVLNTLKEYRPDGMIICPANGAEGESLSAVAATGIPVVQVTREIAGVDETHLRHPRTRGVDPTRHGHQRGTHRHRWRQQAERHHENPDPEMAAGFTRTSRVLKSLDCDIFLGAHGLYYNMPEKYRKLKPGNPNPFIDPTGYREYVAEREQYYLYTLAKQQKQ